MGNFIGWYDATRVNDNEYSGYSIPEYDDSIVQDANMTVETTEQHYKHFEQVIEEKITYSVVTKLDKHLDIYEKVSLMFLLYDSPDVVGLLNNIITDVNVTPVSGWAERTLPNWKPKLVEALSIIQNYKELALLGFNKTDVDAYFLPYIKDTTVCVNKFRKFLYTFCESFTREDCKRLIDHVNIHNVTSAYCDEVFLEIHLLSWIQHVHGYISMDGERSPDLEFLVSKLKQLDFLDKANEIQNIKKIEGYENIYPILDHRDVGVCLIINQRDFYIDRRPQFVNKVREGLDKRDGTDVDCKSLYQTFENFKITVGVRENIKHDDMKSAIISAVNNLFKENHSVFILCILSHGTEGAVYGSNGIPVEIKSIKRWLTVDLHQKLKGKPKVIIVQACQGTSVQKVDDDDDDFDTDAPHPKQCDILVCYAVIPGYVALRDKNKGSIYIQSLCEQLNRSGKKEDIVSILIDVNNDVNKFYHHKHGAMTPTFTVELRKKLYLVPINRIT